MNYNNYRFIAWLIPVILITMACDSGVKIYELRNGLDEKNALRYNIQFKTEEPTDTHIEYWPSDDNTHLFSTSISMNAEQHEYKLIGMYPNKEYTYHIVTKHYENGSMVKSEQYYFKTDSLPDTLPKFKLVADKGDAFNGFILVRKIVAPGCAIILDHTGNIVWYELRDIKLMNAFSWTANNTIISLDNENSINEIDLFGNQIFELQKGEKNLSSKMHHEIRRVDNDDILVLTHKFTKFDLSEFGGNANDSIKADGLLRLDSVGNQVWSWDMLDFADPLKDKDILTSKQDWTHANSVNVTHDGNYIISYRNFDQIWKIDSSTGEIIWKLGKNGDFELEDDNIFYDQHAVHELGENEFLILDNGDNVRKSSRALIIKIDEDDKRILASNSVFLPDSLFSYKQGSVYEMNNGNFLFSVATKKKIAITDGIGNVLWQVNSDAPHYRAYYVRDLPKQSW